MIQPDSLSFRVSHSLSPLQHPSKPPHPPVDTESFKVGAFHGYVGEVAVFRAQKPAAGSALETLDQKLLTETHEKDLAVARFLDRLSTRMVSLWRMSGSMLLPMTSSMTDSLEWMPTRFRKSRRKA